MATIGPITVPPALEPVVPYLKFAAAVAGVVATAIVTLVAAPPAWALIVITVFTALGVYSGPNSAVKAVLSDGMGALTSAEDVVSDAKAGNLSQAEQDAADALKDAQQGVQDVTTVVTEIPKP